MAEFVADIAPEEYDPVWLTEQLRKLEALFQGFELDMVTLLPQAVAPSRLWEGLVVFADGTNWNPGAGAGLYEYRGGIWQKL